ncbi:MAG: UvrD-helicase domain-containing protein [Deltaproteobacteria bacterium]|jgi:DNA helicase-2/ATP-dependent DNA helicase PcrA|nr:UvrD-helicase domain-containing protein [Deltaproteobacteria bacterium]
MSKPSAGGRDVFYADLHLHSRHSMATARDITPITLRNAALAKGIDLIGTGDMTHPGWLQELGEALVLKDSGFYSLKGEAEGPLFAPTGEVSCVYRQKDATRKVHLVFIAPDLEAAGRFSRALAARGNVSSDGRPILGMSARDVTEIALTADPRMLVVPAHVWTPWFSLFGSKSGFDRLEDCFLDLSGHVRSLETGLSSDPEMNRLVSALDGYFLISSSDAHSPDKIGREATVFNCPKTRDALWRALEEGVGLHGTVEFFPEEGKYHLDGHAACGVVLSPRETRDLKGICPVCGKSVTVGVLSRVIELADREIAPPDKLLPDWHILPLAEILGQVLERGPTSRAVREGLRHLLKRFKSEYYLLLDAPPEEIERQGSRLLRVAVERMRAGEVELSGGYDGVFGTVKVLSKWDIKEHSGHGVLFEAVREAVRRRGPLSIPVPGSMVEGPREAADGAETPAGAENGDAAGSSSFSSFSSFSSLEPSLGDSSGLSPSIPPGASASAGFPGDGAPGEVADLAGGKTSSPPRLKELNPSQRAAVLSRARSLCVVAGPGSGKTRVLVARALEYLFRGLPPEALLLTTFTRKAAQTIKQRLLAENPEAGAARVSTVHALAHRVLLEEGAPGRRLAPEDFTSELAKKLIKGRDIGPQAFLRLLSRAKNLLLPVESAFPELGSVMAAYQAALEEAGFLDFDDLVAAALPLAARAGGRFQAVLADECQDLSPLERRFISLVSREADLTVIGDPDQRIYGFRGALPDFQAAFKEDRADLETLKLNVNYRSTILLHKAAEKLRGAKADDERFPAAAEEGRRVVKAALATPAAEAYYVVKRIKDYLGTLFLGGGGGTDLDESRKLPGLGDIAIIYRLRIQGEEILKTLVEDGLPCQISGEDGIDAQDGLDLKAEKISLLTMHAAKGLEFRLVFVTGLEDGIIPAPPRGWDPFPEGADERLSEERRLFYVAVTRARETLYLTRAKKRRLYGRFLSGEPSPFWNLIPEKLTVEARPGAQQRLRNNTLF